MSKKIPDFKSLEEAADYWDTHSFAECITEPVEIEVNLEDNAGNRERSF